MKANAVADARKGHGALQLEHDPEQACFGVDPMPALGRDPGHRLSEKIMLQL